MRFFESILIVALLIRSADSHVRTCATLDPDAEEKEQANVVMRTFIAGGRSQVKREVVEIETYWHTIHTSGGEGELSKGAINDSIQVINNAFAPYFKFVLRKSTKSTNANYWGLDGGLSQNQYYMKKELRRGSCAALNIYSSYLTNDLLGWATYPGFCKNDQIYDGVVIGYGTVPGGSLAP